MRTAIFLVIMDSDCIVPPGYFETVYAEVEACGIAFYGGPDMAAPDFSPLQKAVSYSMTSVFTTGGIRGNRRSIGKFSPRSFNLGISRPLFEQVGGFSDMRIGEDIDFSMRVMAAGAQAWFLPDAKVCHKRRTSIRLFFKQVFVFGTARVNLDIRHPESRRALFMLPSLFTIGSAALLLAALCTSPWFLLAVVGVAALWALGTPVQWGGLLLVLFGAVYAPWWFSLPFGALMLLWFADASVRNRSVAIGWLAVWTSFIQLYGYGAGYLYGLWLRRVLRKDEPYTYRVTKFFLAEDALSFPPVSLSFRLFAVILLSFLSERFAAWYRFCPCSFVFMPVRIRGGCSIKTHDYGRDKDTFGQEGGLHRQQRICGRYAGRDGHCRRPDGGGLRRRRDTGSPG